MTRMIFTPVASSETPLWRLVEMTNIPPGRYVGSIKSELMIGSEYTTDDIYALVMAADEDEEITIRE